MADIFREVDEEVRRDKALEFWTKYQNYLIGLAIVIVLATTGWRAFDNWKTKKAEEIGSRYQTALNLEREGKADEANAAYKDVFETSEAGYAVLGRFKVAGSLGDKDAAAGAKAFDALASDPKVDPVLQDVARLRSAMLKLNGPDAAETRRRLESMAAAGQPFRHSARELLAVSALDAEDYESAGKWLDMLVVDQQTPAGLRQRAEALLGLVTTGKPAAP